jgi:hypothetical protein
MFTIKKIKAPIHLYFIAKYPFPEGISRAWGELERHTPERSGVKFYGIFDGQQYFAGSDDPSRISISRESLQEYIIPVGNYLALTIQNWQDKKEQSMFTMDYDNTDAFSIFKQQTGSTWRMGLVMFDKNTSEEFETKGSGGTPRVIMANDNKDAVFIFRDTKGRDRILLMVDKYDTPFIQVLDFTGKFIKELIKE